VDTLETESHTEQTESEAERLGDDLLIGAVAIADELRAKPHQVNHIFRTRKLPIGKMGKLYIASKKQLRRAAYACIA
jgi:hypothetical protein